MKPHKAFPIHLFAVVALLVIGIVIGRTTEIPCAEYRVLRMLLHPCSLSILFIMSACISVFMQSFSQKGSKAALAATCIIMGMTLIRLNDYNTPYRLRHYSNEQPTYMDSHTGEQRSRLADIYSANGIHNEEKAVITAMTLGDRDGVSQKLRNAYNKSSAAHVFALSGLHIGILFAFIACILPRKRFPVACAMAVLATIWGYTILVGAKPSILRATIMLSIYTIIPLTGRRTTGIAIVLTTCFFLLIARPDWVFNASFQMSFAAVISITAFFSHIYHPELLPFCRVPKWKMKTNEDRSALHNISLHMIIQNPAVYLLRWLYSISAVSVTAQVAVMPFIFFYFGNITPWFLLTNCVVSPCTLVIIPTAMATLIMGCIEPYIPFLSYPLSACAFILNHVTHFLNTSVTWIASLPGNI